MSMQARRWSRIFLYGAGGMGCRIRARLRAIGLPIAGFIDSRADVSADPPRVSLQTWLDERRPDDLIAISSSFAVEIATALFEHGVEDFRDWRHLDGPEDEAAPDPFETDCFPSELVAEVLFGRAIASGALDMLMDDVMRFPSNEQPLMLHRLVELCISHGRLPLLAYRLAELAHLLQPDNPRVLANLGHAAFLAGRRSRFLQVWNRNYFWRDRDVMGRNVETMVLPESWGTAIGHIAQLEFVAMLAQMKGVTAEFVLPIRQHLCLNPFLLKLAGRFIRVVWVEGDDDFDGLHVSSVPGRRIHSYQAFAMAEDKPFTPASILEAWDRTSGETLFAVDDVRNSLPSEAQNVLFGLGLEPSQDFITLHVRSDLQHGYSLSRAVRSCNLRTFDLLIDDLINHGFKVALIGTASSWRLPGRDGLIDLTVSDRPDWLDAYLLSHCAGFIGTNSGPASMAQAFGVPCLFTNCIPFHEPPRRRSTLYLPKLLKSSTTGSWIPFSAMLGEPQNLTESPEALAAAGLEACDNSSDELIAAGRQLVSEIRGIWRAPVGDAARQARLREAVAHPDICVTGRIGALFLEKHADLL